MSAQDELMQNWITIWFLRLMHYVLARISYGNSVCPFVSPSACHNLVPIEARVI